MKELNEGKENLFHIHSFSNEKKVHKGAKEVPLLFFLMFVKERKLEILDVICESARPTPFKGGFFF